MPKISVIVSVYNEEKYLRRCLDSILNQTYKDIEIIIINDGSTDNSEDIILEYKEKYLDIIKYFKKNNTGIAETRNVGIEKAAGEYFIFVDADDYVEHSLIEKLMKCVTVKNIDVVKYRMVIVKKNEEEKIDGPVFEEKTGEEAFNELCFKDILIDTPCLYLFNTKFYKGNNFRFLKDTYHEDFGLIPLIMVKAQSVKSLDIYGYKYMQVEDSITRNEDYGKTVKRANDLFVHYDNMIKEIKNMMLNKNTVSNLKQYYTNAILNAIKKLKRNERKKYIQEIEKRKLIKNIKVKKIKQLIKKIIIIIKVKIG